MVEAVSPYSTHLQATEVGALIPIGGKATYENLRLVASNMTDGSGLTILSVTASPDQVDDKYLINSDRFASAFAELGIRGDIFHLQESTSYTEGRRMLEDSSVVFITGGSQERGVESLRRSGLYEVLHEVYNNGVTVSGTSAGASMLPRYMPDREAIIEGLGLIDGVFIDQHFGARPWRRKRAESAAALGFVVYALNEGSGIVLKHESAIVFGNGLTLFNNTTDGVVSRDVPEGPLDHPLIGGGVGIPLAA